MVVQVNVNFQGEFYRKSGRSPRSYTNGPYSNGKRSIQIVTSPGKYEALVEIWWPEDTLNQGWCSQKIPLSVANDTLTIAYWFRRRHAKPHFPQPLNQLKQHYNNLTVWTMQLKQQCRYTSSYTLCKLCYFDTLPRSAFESLSIRLSVSLYACLSVCFSYKETRTLFFALIQSVYGRWISGGGGDGGADAGGDSDDDYDGGDGGGGDGGGDAGVVW